MSKKNKEIEGNEKNNKDIEEKELFADKQVHELPKRTAGKRKMSPNSLRNLVQYNPKISKKIRKERINKALNISAEELKALQDEAAADESLSFFKTLKVRVGGKLILLSELIDAVFPTYQTLNKREMVVFNNIAATYLKDFENEELSYSDMDDVFSLAMNKILELRLLKLNKKKSKMLPDLLVSLEKIKKQNDKLRESLSNTRKDRKKRALKTGVSILDLAAEFDEKRERELKEKEEELLKKEKEFLKNRTDCGNFNDIDTR